MKKTLILLAAGLVTLAACENTSAPIDNTDTVDCSTMDPNNQASVCGENLSNEYDDSSVDNASIDNASIDNAN